MMSGFTEPLVSIRNVSVDFPVRGAVGAKKKLHAVSNVSLEIQQGETFGLVGESGCGKSTLANAVLGMVPINSGSIVFQGQDINGIPKNDFYALRRSMQMIFQDPFSSLNPRFDVYRIISEPLLVRGERSRTKMEKRVLELLDLVGLPANSLHKYPSVFSGGQRQRIGIARAIALNPVFLVCDEPVSALDVSVHAQILNLLMDLQKELNISYLFISHDLSVVKDICTSLAVMYLGGIVETGDAKTLFENPVHPYTVSLLSAILDTNAGQSAERIILKGEIPSPIDLPPGCSFSTRCPFAKSECSEKSPELAETGPGHRSACFYNGKIIKPGNHIEGENLYDVR
jgi:oligopeptide transport system ATP-binding protein